MVQPQYSNAFTVTLNPQLGEIVINFAQEYPVLRDQAQTNAIPSGKIQTDTERKDVCGIVISEGTAKQLFEILKNIFSSTNAE